VNKKDIKENIIEASLCVFGLSKKRKKEATVELSKKTLELSK